MIGSKFVNFLCLIFLTHGVEGKVRCYVCSWQSPTYGSTNMTDTCSHYNFDPVYSVVVECDGGCEAVSIRKSQNGDVVNFYKNCVPSSKSSRVEDTCKTTENSSMQFVTTCECASDLCNKGRSIMIADMSKYLLIGVFLSSLFFHNEVDN